MVTCADRTGDFDEFRPPAGVAGRRFELPVGDNTVTLSVEPSADLDGDGYGDLADHIIFAACMKGPGVPVTEPCEVVDLDGDGDADLADFAAFERLMDGV